MRRWDTVAIVGVGLIGGSIGLALRQRGLARRVMGIGRRSAGLRTARARGAITHWTTQLARGVADAEMIVVCTPVRQIVAHVRAVAEHCPAGALVTDAGSVKGSIVRALSEPLSRGVRFVGSHPLAGSEKSGVGFACGELFEGRVAIVTPGERTPSRDVAQVASFWAALGARVICQSPQQHDRVAAATGHAPHLLASALAAATPRRYLACVAGGWLGTTRIAAGDPALWCEILVENRSNLLAALDRFNRMLARFRAALQREDRAKLQALIQAGKQNRDSVGN